MSVFAQPPPVDPFTAARPTCSRCGDFMSADATGEPLCVPCIERNMIEPLRGPLSGELVLRGVGVLSARVGFHALWITLLFAVPGYVLEHLVPNLPAAFQAINGAVALVGELAVMVLAHDVLRGRDVDVGRAFGDGLSRYGAAFVVRFVSGLLTLLWALLFLLPGIYKAAAYSVAAPIAVFEQGTGTSAIDQSIERTRPHMFLILGSYGVLAVAFIGWLGVLIAAYATLGAASLSPTLPWLIDGAGEVGFSVVVVLSTFVQMIFYVKLSRVTSLSF